MSQSNVSSSEPELIESVPKRHLLVANECWFAMKKVLFATNKYSFATKNVLFCRKQMLVCDEEGFVCYKQIFVCGEECFVCRKQCWFAMKKVLFCHKQIFVCDEEGLVCHKQIFVCDEESFVCHKQIFVCDEEGSCLPQTEVCPHSFYGPVFPEINEIPIQSVIITVQSDTIAGKNCEVKNENTAQAEKCIGDLAIDSHCGADLHARLRAMGESPGGWNSARARW